MDFLVACHSIVLSGGLLRFDRIAQTIAPHGHRVSFVALGSGEGERKTHLDVLDLPTAEARQWSAVMIPGAGFPSKTIAQFATFRRSQFGTRIQFILNDQTRKDAFQAVNTSFDPHIVIFNNDHWPQASFSMFKADRFHTIVGAVDTTHFFPSKKCNLGSQWIIGGLANKNPVPLVAAVGQMEGVILKLFGQDSHNLAQRFGDLVDSGRLQLVGIVDDGSLPSFYHKLDCVVMTEMFAGWANLAAEAMASGIPVICTPHGTTAFAHDGETAIVVDDPTPEVLVRAIGRLRSDAMLCQNLSKRGREKIEKFDWLTYCSSLLKLCQHSTMDS